MNTKHDPNRQKPRKLLFFMVLAILITIVATDGYIHHKESRVTSLRGENTSLRQQPSDNEKTQQEILSNNESITYRPKVGGLSLAIPGDSVVIEYANGNRGGAPGFEFTVAKKLNEHIIDAHILNPTTIKVQGDNTLLQSNGNPTYDELQPEAERQKIQLENTGFGNINIDDTKVAGYNAKIVKGEPIGPGYSYPEQRIVTGSGTFLYIITSPQTDEAQEYLQEVLSNITISPVST